MVSSWLAALHHHGPGAEVLLGWLDSGPDRQLRSVILCNAIEGHKSFQRPQALKVIASADDLGLMRASLYLRLNLNVSVTDTSFVFVHIW